MEDLKHLFKRDDDIDLYYPGFTNLYNTLLRFSSKINFKYLKSIYGDILCPFKVKKIKVIQFYIIS